MLVEDLQEDKYGVLGTNLYCADEIVVMGMYYVVCLSGIR